MGRDIYRRGCLGQVDGLRTCHAAEQVLDMKRNEEQEWAMAPTNTAVSTPLSLASAGGAASGHW